MLTLRNVRKEYPPAEPGAPGPVVLRDVNFHVDAGQTVAVVGPSGSGKSTLPNLIGGLDRPSAGRVVLDGEDLGDLSDRDLTRLRNREIGFVFQMHHLLGQLTILENVLVPTLAGGTDRTPAAARDDAVRLLERVGLAGRMGHRPRQLSGGERQRAAVVRALINRPRLLLADEPTGALDQDTATELADLLVSLHDEEGTTLIVVTHATSLAARMSRQYALREGTLTGEANAS